MKKDWLDEKPMMTRMGLGETERCAEKREKAGGTRLLALLSCSKSAREAREGGGYRGREGGSALR